MIKFLCTNDFSRLFFNGLLQNLPTTGVTHVLQDLNVYRRISRLASISKFNQEVEFGVLPWLLNDNVELMEVPASPKLEVTSDDESSDENSEANDSDEEGHDDNNDDDEPGDEMNVNDNVADVQAHLNEEVAHDEVIQQVI